MSKNKKNSATTEGKYKRFYLPTHEQLMSMEAVEFNCWLKNYPMSIRLNEEYLELVVKERISKIFGDDEILDAERPLEIVKCIIRTKEEFNCDL